MNAQVKDCGGQSGPPHGILQLEMVVNTTDKELLTNLKFCKSLGLPSLPLMEANKKTLAIVGSGPSLRDTWGLIPRDAEIMALNGAYKFLRTKGIIPTYFAMLDSRQVNVNFLQDLHPNSTYLLASQSHPDVFMRLKGRVVGVFHLSTPTTRRIFTDEDLYVGGGGTIGLTALGLAMAMGYRNVILYGYDSSFSGEERHVLHQPQNDSQSTLDVWVKDRKYTTSHAMAAQTMDFFPFWSAIKKECPEFEVHLIGNGLFYDYVVTNNGPMTREKELAKYAEAYLQPDYGMTKERYDGIVRLVSEVSGESYLDVSTGRGETLDIARKHGFGVVSGTETVDALLNEHVGFGVLPNLSIPDKAYDVVSLFEVIEHLVPDDVEASLYELTRIARRHIFISASVSECWLGGVNLHPSARPLDQWQELFTKVWGNKVRRMHNLGGSPSWRVDL